MTHRSLVCPTPSSPAVRDLDASSPLLHARAAAVSLANGSEPACQRCRLRSVQNLANLSIVALLGVMLKAPWPWPREHVLAPLEVLQDSSPSNLVFASRSCLFRSFIWLFPFFLCGSTITTIQHQEGALDIGACHCVRSTHSCGGIRQESNYMTKNTLRRSGPRITRSAPRGTGVPAGLPWPCSLTWPPSLGPLQLHNLCPDRTRPHSFLQSVSHQSYS